eukprot:CAMPEP_0114118376 /NCGR_PEP_ID=MMETSP0043_2-20121206/5547_1 /TAXON_ID=464988 /ORGANISM="Hemiselmis andersenii, Strain CCMP644" /LENGTH=146 /DNA_ID=CAMNT_0001210857 /DNA_START=84 /DNA_END=524 /DNA_ORIENTATION=+
MGTLDSQLVAPPTWGNLDPQDPKHVPQADVEPAGAHKVVGVWVYPLHRTEPKTLDPPLHLSRRNGPVSLQNLSHLIRGALNLSPHVEVLLFGALHRGEKLADGEGKLRLSGSRMALGGVRNLQAGRVREVVTDLESHNLWMTPIRR